MIGTLPSPYPGELLYSLCARYCDRMQYPSKRSVVQDLFGTGNVIASIWLPSHIDEFIAALPPGHPFSADDLIDNHTLLPFYAPFVLPERLQQLRQDMHGRNGPGIHMRIGIMASHVPLPEWLRFCSHCVEEDRKQYGECYWHRVHQVPGVEICPVHETRLQNSTVHARNMKTRYEFVSAENALLMPHHLVLPDRCLEILLRLAHDAQWLLNQPCLPHDLASLHNRYRRILNDLGLATYRGRVDANALLKRFMCSYSPQLLNLLNCKLDECVTENWLLRLVRTPDNAQHPLHHLLLIYCLGYTAETFFGLPSENAPFGAGPWPCLNPTCNHYRQHSIKECHILHSQYVGGKPIGTFSCTCGFIYARTGPDTSPTDQFRLSRVQAFGHVWENRLRVLWENDAFSLRGIARQLGVDPLTVKRHATRLVLPFPRPVRQSLPLKKTQQLRPHVTQKPKPTNREAYRASWLAARQENPHSGVKALRSKVPGVYSWLYRNDTEWLREHLPFCKERKVRQPRIDWMVRDAQITEEVKASAIRLRNAPGRPMQVTISAIGREIGQLALIQQHLNKLPRTAEALKELIETREEFAVRRIWWAMTTFSQKQLYPARWLLIKKAGVSRLIEWPQVRKAIDAALKALQLNENIDWDNTC